MNDSKMEVLHTSSEYLGKLIPGINNILEFYRSGNELKANRMIIDVIDGLLWLTEAFTLTQDIQKEKMDVSCMNEHLSEMLSAFENSDYVLLSDLLEYEVLPILKKWHLTLAKTTGM